MKREWKLGDVALNVAHGYRGIFIESCRIPEHSRDGGSCWHNESGLSDSPDDVRRPLVVIDPEDRNSVRLLADALFMAHFEQADGATRNADATQAALRSLITPPRPEEPTGLGAVVEDADGNVYTRTDRGALPWFTCYVGGNAGRCDWTRWDKIAAVRVLSEGVPS